MKISRKDLKRLVEKYVKEQDEELGQSDAETGMDLKTGEDNATLDDAMNLSKDQVNKALSLARSRTGKELPKTVPNESSESEHLSYLKPEFASKIKVILGKLKGQGFQPVIYTSFRDAAEQLQKKKAGVSGSAHFGYHVQYGLTGDPKGSVVGVDIIDDRYGWCNKGKAKISDKNRPTPEHLDSWKFFMELGKAAREAGLTWGGDWKFFKSGKPPGKKKRGGKVLHTDGNWYKSGEDTKGAEPFLFGADPAHVEMKIPKDKIRKMSAYGVLKKLGKLA